jgi:hypothetical protein
MKKLTHATPYVKFPHFNYDGGRVLGVKNTTSSRGKEIKGFNVLSYLFVPLA